MNNIYRENILDHYKNPRNYGKIDNADLTYEEENSSCGDRIAISLKLKVYPEKVIEAIRFYGEGCAISIASASMLSEKVIGKKINEVRLMSKKDILAMLGIELTPTRLKCALLPLEVLHKTLTLVKDK